ncbi:MAG: adenine deaminase [Epsilonproteobacteria bacterium (ex Lamellibrachia satsuma)]|nr:MAG: adenine deaminase [Epsilonproteobacteria bacterium (ex Lamellibrachia satsuma)]
MHIKSNLVDIESQEIRAVALEVEEGFIESIVETDGVCSGYILPGFIDAHIHIESSMLIPSEFARIAVTHGTVATVSDPHEIANVLGLSGVEFMLDNASKTNFKFYFGASPCVPATPFETNGATLGVDEIKELLQNPKIKFLSEVMNVPGVLAKDKDIMEKIALAKSLNKPIDGHAPGLRGENLTRYIESGISTDHEAFSYEEALEKLHKGMKIILREGSAAKNFEALHPLIDNYHKDMMFCSDDKHPNDLFSGHINKIVARAVALGHDIFDVLEMACLNPIRHYGLDVGTLHVGDKADFIIVENLEDFKVLKTVINGVVVAENQKTKLASVSIEAPNHFEALPKKVSDFFLPTCEVMEVIQVVNNELITYEKVSKSIEHEEDILKIAVINRYKNTKISGIAHVKGFGLKEGAIASSVAHDSHNIIVVGCSDEAMAKAANLVIESCGGISAVDYYDALVLPLHVAGIMSAEDGFGVAKEYENIDRFVKERLGSKLSAPFMTLSFMALLVIPEIKLSDKGLFDGRSFHFISPCKTTN